MRIGDVVSQGKLLAEIDQSELRDKIKESEATLERLRHEDERLTLFDEAEAQSHVSALEELERTLRHNIELDRRRLDAARKIASGDRRLNVQRMLNDSDTLKSRSDADAIESAVGTVEARLVELGYERLKDQTVRRKDKLKRGLTMRAAETDLALLCDKLRARHRSFRRTRGRSST